MHLRAKKQYHINMLAFIHNITLVLILSMVLIVVPCDAYCDAGKYWSGSTCSQCPYNKPCTGDTCTKTGSTSYYDCKAGPKLVPVNVMETPPRVVVPLSIAAGPLKLVNVGGV